ncbi:MAG TPA: zf-HC2 domain-containing protein [Thermoanaerobaculia bacterium]|nr:zf-HC2 domain-containing protein [Thermoanaerobaculia bacterium]
MDHAGTKRLIAYREGTLPEAEREALQEHLSLCPRCTGLLRDLRDFEAAAAGAVETGPEPLRQEAWESLVRRLPRETKTPPAVRPVPTLPARRQPVASWVYAVAAALLLAAVGFSIWSAVMVRQERRRLADLEQRLEERESALAEVQRALAESERQLQAALGRIQGLQKDQPDTLPDTRETELEARIAELTADLEKLRRTPRTPGGPDRITAGPRQIDLSVAPRFALRGQEPGGGVLRGGGAVNPVRQADRVTLAVDLSDHPVHAEYRFELMDENGKVLWAGRRPGKSLLGDAGTTLSVSGLAPGSYRLRIEGLGPDRTELLGEYLLEVQTPK